jgi:hypothetical protein
MAVKRNRFPQQVQVSCDSYSSYCVPHAYTCVARVAFHWDNIHEAQQLLIRPAAPGWPWSGAFNLPDREAYFGLRLRNR